MSKLSLFVWISKSAKGSVASIAGSATSDESYIRNIKWIKNNKLKTKYIKI